jgi:hypothetical protein
MWTTKFMEGESTRITNFCRMFHIKEASELTGRASEMQFSAACSSLVWDNPNWIHHIHPE